MRAGHVILTLNRGSSSLKFALYRARRNEPELLARGAVENLDAQPVKLWLRDARGKELARQHRRFSDEKALIAFVFSGLAEHNFPLPTIVGHRLVHGGPRYFAPVRITARVRAALNQAMPFAPLHLPVELAAVDAVADCDSSLPQVACFDTAFHAAMPERARRLPLPDKIVQPGVHRYGFHGLSYEHLVHRLGAKQLRRAVLAHLGNGASLAAVERGRPVDTTMGFTPAGGIPMSTRTGDLDPGVIVHWLRTQRGNADELERMIFCESGLRAISGTSGDLRELLARRRRDRRSRLAVEIFCYQVRQRIGALAAALGGIDTLVFTGGVGEHLAEVRAEICTGLDHLGIRLEARRNARHAAVISAAGARVMVRVEPADEDIMIARHALRVLPRR